jgi:glycosyltransferase involved in cell wall biosynthesis
MTSSPIVSIITIFRDPPVRFFEAAIESVLAQTEQSWELLLVDDGTKDGSAEVARRAVSERPGKIRLLQHPGGVNRGMSASRNLGIATARGRFVAFLDADDLYLPVKLERQLADFAEHPDAAIVYGPTLHWWSWSGDPRDVARDHPRRLGATPGLLIPPPSLAELCIEDRADTPATSAVLVRREAIEAVGGFEEAFADLYEDQAFFYKILLRYPAYLEAVAWDRYRRHKDALCEVRIREGSHSDDTRPTQARGRFLEWLSGYIRTTGIHHAAILRSIRRQQWPYRHPKLYACVAWVSGIASPFLPRGLRRRTRRIVNGLPPGS